MIFYCKNCNKEFEVDDKECKGYYNWKCPECKYIANKKDMSLGFGIIWNCDTGTVKRSSYIDTSSKKETKETKVKDNPKCSNCKKIS